MPADPFVLKKDHSKLQESLKVAQQKIVTLEVRVGRSHHLVTSRAGRAREADRAAGGALAQAAR